MIAALVIGCIVLLAVGAALVWHNGVLRVKLRATAANADRFEQCVRNNLRAIRARVGYGFPESVRVCNALESALQARCRVDLDTLERQIIALRRARDAELFRLPHAHSVTVSPDTPLVEVTTEGARVVDGFAEGRAAGLSDAIEAIDAQIVPGQLKGDGFDATAERNGLIAASNTLVRMRTEYRLKMKATCAR